MFSRCVSSGLVICLVAACQPDLSMVSQVNDELSSQHGTFAVAFRDLTSGETLLINEHETFHAASTMKTPVMIEVFKQASEGRLSLHDSVAIKNEFRSIVDGTPYSLSPGDDSEGDLYKIIGKKRSLSSVVYDMIISSSNLATNIIIELVDARKVTETMRAIGAPDIQVLRGVEDSKAYARGMNNTTTAYDLMVIFERLAREEMVDEAASRAMIDILLDQRFNEIIPALLPKDVRVAHKTGNITGVRHDSGIVILPDGRRYVLVILSKDLDDEKGAIESMARVSRIIYDHVEEI